MDAVQKTQLETARASYWVRRLADEREVTVDQLAVHSGISRGAIFNMRKGVPPTLKTLSHLALYFGVDVRDLLQPIPDGVDTGGELA